MMKQSILNLLFSFLAFCIAYVIAYLTGLKLIQQAIWIAFIIQWVAFIPAYIFQTEKFYDLTGSITYISVVSYVCFESKAFNGNIGSILLSSFIMLWAIRLGSFLYLRIHKAGKDKRFKFIKPSPTRFFMTWTLQGMWVSLCSMCALTAIASKNGVIVNALFFIGAFVFLTGLTIEIIADKQKSKFRENPENKDQFITHGLWSYSRHPNYFGEITLWLGIAIMSLSSLNHWQFLTLISPIFTYLLLVYVSGVRLLEISGMEKWGHLKSYQDYIRTTPSLFPFKKLFMKKVFIINLVFCLSFSMAIGQRELTTPLSLNTSSKSIGIISTINTPVIEGNQKGQLGIGTNQTKLYFKYNKNKTAVFFEALKVSEIMSTGLGTKLVKKNAVSWSIDVSKEEKYKLYITSTRDSAQNYIIYSGYVYFPNLNKWKLIASFKMNGYNEYIHTATIFKTKRIQEDTENLYTDTWVQIENGSWINIQNKGIQKPILIPFSDMDSISRAKLDSLTIRKAIEEKQTDAVLYKNGLYYHLMKSSESQSFVKITDTVSIYYKGYIFGTDIIFDQTVEDTRTFPLGRLIKGWQIGLEGTRVGEKIKLLIPSGLAYSIRTRSPKIPPNSILVFEIETVKAVSP